MLIVLDTNVLVSSLLKKSGNPAVILNLILDGEIRLAIDERIFREYTQVLQRPRFNFDPAQLESVLRFVSFSSLWTHCEVINFPKVLVNDPGDLPFAEVAITSQAEFLVTGNKKHFLFMADPGVKIVLPQEFLEQR